MLDATGVPVEEGIAPGAFVRLSVSDTGHGMTPEVQARAFEPFFTTKDVGRGSGLGLSTLHGFVRQSGGFVTLESEVGRGTVVDVYLPRSDGIEGSAKPNPPPIVRGAGETILLVEDDADVRRVMRERLKALGYRVETASDPAAARAVLDTGRPVDLILTDIVMPGGVSGLDFARTLRAEDPARRIVVTSGFAGGPVPAEIEFAFLRKPHSLAELATSVAAELRAPRGE
jgi:CheY-like chemotaxis protein